MSKLKVISCGDGTGREVNPYQQIEYNCPAKIEYDCFEKDNPPLPLLLNGQPFMETGVIVECEKIFRITGKKDGIPEYNHIKPLYGIRELGWKCEDVYNIVSLTNAKDIPQKAESQSEKGAEKETVEHAAERHFPKIKKDDSYGDYITASQRHGFLMGAKWQAVQPNPDVISRKKVVELVNLFMDNNTDSDGNYTNGNASQALADLLTQIEQS